MSKNNSQKTLSVLSYNTFGTPFVAPLITKRYKKIGKELNTSNIDVLCLQEIASYYHLMLLKKALKNYPYVAYKKFVFGPRGGVVIFSKHPIESVRYDSFASLGSLIMYTQLLRNGMLSCRITGTSIRIINTHLITDFEYASSSTNKYYSYVRKQTQEVGVLMNTLGQNETIITVGDFNLANYDVNYKKFVKETGAVDVFAKEKGPTYFHDRFDWKFMAGKSVRIDYIFLLDKYDRIQIQSTEHAFTEQVQLTQKHKTYLSDHIGLLAKFSY